MFAEKRQHISVALGYMGNFLKYNFCRHIYFRWRQYVHNFYLWNGGKVMFVFLETFNGICICLHFKGLFFHEICDFFSLKYVCEGWCCSLLQLCLRGKDIHIHLYFSFCKPGILFSFGKAYIYAFRFGN